jgi:hypothetical protein
MRAKRSPLAAATRAEWREEPIENVVDHALPSRRRRRPASPLPSRRRSPWAQPQLSRPIKFG